MKWNRLFVSCLLILSFHTGISQNLVLNPGLENYISCPGFGQFGPAWVTDWHKPSVGSSDYYHYNCPAVIPPVGSAPRTGNGEGGLILYNFGTEYREYVTATLSQPLVAGNSYYIEFYLALNPGSIQAVEEAGAYLSDSIPGFFANSLTINVTPQIKNTGGALSYGWNKISGYMMATGGETYITFGNFMNDSNTTVSTVGTVGSYGSYYFIDDVLVRGSDSTGTGITAVLNKHSQLMPPLVNSWYAVSLPDLEFSHATLTICDPAGKVAEMFELNGKNDEVSFSRFSAGMYFYVLRSGNRLVESGKFIIQK